MSAATDHYELRYRPTDTTDGWTVMLLPKGTTNVSLDALDRGTNYTIQARAVGPTGLFSAWVAVTHTVAAATRGPIAPTGLAVASTAEGSTLTWAVSDIQPADVEYVIERAPDVSGSPGTFAEYSRTKALQWKDPTADTVLRWYRVRAVSYAGVASAYTSTVSSAGLSLRVAGSGVQIGDLRNLLAIAVGNFSAQVPTVISYTAASGTPATATISVAAFTMTAGSVTVSYNAMSVGTTGTNGTTVTYYLYFDDSGYAGGTRTLVATTTAVNVYASNSRIYVGSIAVTYPSAGSGGGSGGGGGGCVCAHMMVDEQLSAGDVVKGDMLDCMSLPQRGTERFVAPILAVEFDIGPCVQITTDAGAVLDCSEATPFDLLDGRSALAPHMRGEQVFTDRGIETVVTVEHIGLQLISHIHMGGLSYPAGRDPTHRIFSHNMAKP